MIDEKNNDYRDLSKALDPSKPTPSDIAYAIKESNTVQAKMSRSTHINVTADQASSAAYLANNQDKDSSVGAYFGGDSAK